MKSRDAKRQSSAPHCTDAGHRARRFGRVGLGALEGRRPRDMGDLEQNLVVELDEMARCLALLRRRRLAMYRGRQVLGVRPFDKGAMHLRDAILPHDQNREIASWRLLAKIADEQVLQIAQRQQEVIVAHRHAHDDNMAYR
ncbi:hypothetical protein [Reyranella sp.]|uniref:hypothetical protein n=1 Tax=Reyranella sp. TaxID=1929291 RepID=UPI003782D9D0